MKKNKEAQETMIPFQKLKAASTYIYPMVSIIAT